MAGDVVAEVLAHQTHEVVAGIADVVLGLVLVPLHAHVAVDGVEPLRDGAAALDVGLLDADDLEIATPVAGFVRGAAPGHAAADDENVGIDEDGLPPRSAITPTPCFSLSGVRAGSASMCSASGSWASSCEFIAAAAGAS